jgi:hypothetical protein
MTNTPNTEGPSNRLAGTPGLAGSSGSAGQSIETGTGPEMPREDDPPPDFQEFIVRHLRARGYKIWLCGREPRPKDWPPPRPPKPWLDD